MFNLKDEFKLPSLCASMYEKGDLSQCHAQCVGQPVVAVTNALILDQKLIV